MGIDGSVVLSRSEYIPYGIYSCPYICVSLPLGVRTQEHTTLDTSEGGQEAASAALKMVTEPADSANTNKTNKKFTL